jgi:Fur family zinc uptake transcriptional regulator
MNRAMAAAEARCCAAGERWTSPRRRTYELLAQARRPLKAYDIMANYGGATATKPPTVYRALDFLETHGLVHRVATMNAYVACSAGSTVHVPQLLLCECCGRSEERPLDGAAISAAAGPSFEVRSATLELRGLCADCR